MKTAEIDKFKKEMIDRYTNNNETIEQIAKKLGISSDSVYRRLNNAGVPTYKKVNKLRDETQTIINMYQKGMSTIKIAEIFDCTDTAIGRLLKRNGIQTRQHDPIGDFKEVIIDKYVNKNMTITEIGRELGIIRNTVRYNLAKWGYDVYTPVEVKVDKRKVIELFESGESISQIANKLGYSINTVGRRLRKWGYDTSINFKGDPDNLLKDRFNEVLELYNSGIRIEQIGKKLNYSPSSVLRLLRDNNIKIRDDRIGVDENFFKKIDSWEKAYILGWFYSDGNVQRFSIRLCLAERDGYILNWIKNQMNFEGKVAHSDARYINHQPQKVLAISRATIAKDLIALGCVKKKSLILKFPTEDQVPIKFRPDFIKGVLDGDGSTSNAVSFCGSYDMMHALAEILPLEITNIYQSNLKVEPRKCAHKLAIYRKPEVQKFYNYIYYNPSLFCLRRKKHKLEDYLGLPHT